MSCDANYGWNEKKFTKLNFDDYKKRFLSGYENYDTDNLTQNQSTVFAEPYKLTIVKCITINK